MYRFYRMDKDADDNDVLTVVESCAIQGDRIPDLGERYAHALFHLDIDTANKIVVRRQYAVAVPEDVVVQVETWLNAQGDKRPLPTYFHSYILLNGVERVPHLHLVYIAESETEVWDFVND